MIPLLNHPSIQDCFRFLFNHLLKGSWIDAYRVVIPFILFQLQRMENAMNFGMGGKLNTISHLAHLLRDEEWTIAFEA